MTKRLSPGVWLAGVSALTVAAATVVVLPLLPAARQREIGPLLLVAAVMCILVTRHQLRRLQRQQAPGDPAPTLGAVDGGLSPQAVGGPCDGQYLTVPTATPPAEVWLADDNAPDHLQHHRYALERRADGGLRYRYAPPSGS